MADGCVVDKENGGGRHELREMDEGEGQREVGEIYFWCVCR